MRFLLLLAASSIALVSCGGSKTETASAPAASSPTSTQNMHRIEVVPRFFVDQIGAVSSPATDKEISINSSGPLMVGGWAADPSGVAVSGVEVTIDQKPYFTTYGVERPDVALALKNSTYNKFGFQFNTPASQFSNGTHDLTVRIINKDRTGYFETPVYHLRVQ
jgi:hypothetical protein